MLRTVRLVVKYGNGLSVSVLIGRLATDRQGIGADGANESLRISPAGTPGNRQGHLARLEGSLDNDRHGFGYGDPGIDIFHGCRSGHWVARAVRAGRVPLTGDRSVAPARVGR